MFCYKHYNFLFVLFGRCVQINLNLMPSYRQGTLFAELVYQLFKGCLRKNNFFLILKLLNCEGNSFQLKMKKLYLPSYSIIQDNPINGFRPAVTHPSRCLCFLRAYASWSHQSMTGLPRFGPFNEYKVSSSPSSADPRIIRRN